MPDTLSPEQRSWLMAKVRGKDTAIEKKVRSYLHEKGYRFRKHVAGLPGSPDIVLPKYKLAIFIHGCFWHGHEGCSRGKLPKSRIEYWKAKIEANKDRDHRIEEELKNMGWRQITIWECQLRTQKAASVSLPKILEEISQACT